MEPPIISAARKLLNHHEYNTAVQRDLLKTKSYATRVQNDLDAASQRFTAALDAGFLATDTAHQIASRIVEVYTTAHRTTDEAGVAYQPAA